MLCIPVRCRGEMVAVLTRESTPTVGRQPGELERTYVEIFNRFARMIAAGEFPFDARGRRDRGGPARRRRRDRPRCVGPGGVHLAQRRVGPAPHRRPRQRRGPAPRRARPRRRAGPHRLRRSPRRSPRRSSGARRSPCSIRCIPLLDHGTRHRRRGAPARRLRAAPPGPPAAVQGRHHPRDPPPGEEQPADDLVAAAPAGPAASSRRRPRRPSRSRCAASGRSPSCTRSCPARPARTWPSSRSCGPLVRMVEEGAVLARPPGDVPRRGRRRRRCRPRSPRRCRWCSTSCCRTPSTTPSRTRSTCRRPAGSVVVQLDNDGERLRATVVDDGVGLPEGFSLADATGLGLSIVRTLVTTRAGRRRSPRAGTGDGDRPGTVVQLDVPVAERE